MARLAGWELRLVKSAIAIGVLAVEQRPVGFNWLQFKPVFDDLVTSDTELGHDTRAARIAIMREPD